MKTQLDLGKPSWHSNPHVSGTACPGHAVFEKEYMNLLGFGFRGGALSLWLFGLRLGSLIIIIIITWSLFIL